MLNERKIIDIQEECGFLSISGILYYPIGYENGRFIFQELNGDQKRCLTYEELRTDDRFDIAY